MPPPPKRVRFADEEVGSSSGGGSRLTSPPASPPASPGADQLSSWAVAAAIPELQKPWPQGCEQFWRSRDGAAAPPAPVGMRSGFFPLLQVDELVQCRNCQRPIARDAHDAHLRECLAPPTAERMAAEEARLSGGKGRQR